MLVVGTVVAITCAAAPGGGSSSPAAPTSIVQLGDSVAAGEGTLYGYRYDAATREWTGGNLDAAWPPPYPDCHDSPDAYGNHVAERFGAAFQQFACTGATFESGISAPETYEGRTLRPAQFGNWETMRDLNAEYDRAQPDLVLVTLGADDVNFVGIVEACVENAYEAYFDLADLECTAKNPGSTIERDFDDTLATLEDDYRTLVDWITARAEANSVPVPKVVFTTYANPLPPRGTKCPDTSWLDPRQVRYLSRLVGRINDVIASTIEGLDNDGVVVADIAEAYEPAGVDHRWCTDAPWAYGLSIYKVTDPESFESQAPFHPTPAGQESIAAHVIPAVRKLFEG
jgi:GDSL-like Lipase/Acylhydrolase family